MKALVLTHVEHEGPGTLGSYLEERGINLETLRLFAGDPLPADLSRTDLVVVMGGPMNVYDDERHPFLAGESSFIRRAIEDGVTLVGVCLGAQLIARASGARVYRAPEKEVGWGTVSLTGAGVRDPLFAGVPTELPVLQWHEDTFDVPPGGELLATSPACRNQAFRIGRAWGLQFHVEVDGDMLAEWFAGLDGRDEVLRRYGEVRERFDRDARRIYGNLLSLAGAGK